MAKEQQDTMQPIAGLEFTTTALAIDDQFDGYRDFMAPLSDVEPLIAIDTGFLAHARAHDLGALQLVSMYANSASFDYTHKHIRQFGMDHWSLNLVTGGHIEYSSGNGLRARGGELFLHSFASPFAGAGHNLELTHLILNRDAFDDLCGTLDKSVDTALQGALAALLRDFIISLKSHAPTLTPLEIPAVNEAFSQLLKASLRPSAATLAEARLPIAATQFDLVRRTINSNLKSPDLSPEMICARVGISRRQLYYLFEQHGGVMKYINQRRLAACYRELAAQPGRPRVSSIAYAYGYTNLSTFYRQFQARYGFRPGEARAARRNDPALPKAAAGNFTQWLQQVGAS